MQTLLMVPLADIDLDYRVYPRQQIQRPRVAELRAAMKGGNKLPPIVVCHVPSRTKYIIVDGAHRRQLYIEDKINSVEVDDLGQLTEAEAIKTGYKLNTTGPLQLTGSDRRVAAQKMIKLGININEINVLTHIEEMTIRSLAAITYEDEGRTKVLPRALIRREDDASFSTPLSPTEIQTNADIISSIPRNFSPRSAARYLGILIEHDWIALESDPEIAKMIRRLDEKIHEFLKI